MAGKAKKLVGTAMHAYTALLWLESFGVSVPANGDLGFPLSCNRRVLKVHLVHSSVLHELNNPQGLIGALLSPTGKGPYTKAGNK